MVIYFPTLTKVPPFLKSKSLNLGFAKSQCVADSNSQPQDLSTTVPCSSAQAPQKSGPRFHSYPQQSSNEIPPGSNFKRPKTSLAYILPQKFLKKSSPRFQGRPLKSRNVIPSGSIFIRCATKTSLAYSSAKVCQKVKSPVQLTSPAVLR